MIPDRSSLANLSTPAKLGVAALAAAGAAAAAGWFWVMRIALAVVLGFFAIGMLLFAYRTLRKQRDRRKGNALAGKIQTSGKATEINKPDDLAKLDDLQKTFNEGLEKFRAAGKDLYSLPWYLVIGESGAGKTEAIRRCGLGFPPGLQDELQGVGGTVNMNWWFTNRAVILDTAGEMVFPEVGAGETAEWHVFLDLLKKNRRNCPINGLILVIPADGFFLTEKDRHEGLDLDQKIQKKSGAIARQIELIKHKLEVRFPVYLMITKTDLIVGFREFFDTLDDPSLQHQILGWAKPGSLDEPFQPEEVVHYLETVRGRLLRKRLGALLEPINSDDPTARRIDQVDSLYTFPNNLVQQVGPPLRRYLELIFAADGWSEKVLLFRGIFFTSAMREGSELDEEIATLLEVPVESLPEGRVWRRDKAFFLYDLFIKKIVPERGLVTRASNIGRLQRRRRALLLGALIASALVLTGLSWVSYDALEKTTRNQLTFWKTVHEAYEAHGGPEKARDERWRIVYNWSDRWSDTDYHYGGRKALLDENGEKLRIGDGGEIPCYQLSGLTRRSAEETIDKPWIFWWIRPGEIDVLREERVRAHQRLYEKVVLEPLFEAAMHRLLASAELKWRSDASATRAWAILIEAISTTEPADLDLGPLFEFTLSSREAAEDLPAVRSGFLRTADGLSRFRRFLETLEVGASHSQAMNLVDAIDRTLARFEAAWRETDPFQEPPPETVLEEYTRLVAALAAFEAAEAGLRQATANTDASGDFAVTKGEWDSAYAALRRALEEAETAARNLEAAGNLALDALAKQLEVDYTSDLRLAVKTLQAATHLPGAEPHRHELRTELFERLAELERGALQTAKEAVAKRVGEMRGALREITSASDAKSPLGARAWAYSVATDDEPEQALALLETTDAGQDTKLASAVKTGLSFASLRAFDQQHRRLEDIGSRLARLRERLVQARSRSQQALPVRSLPLAVPAKLPEQFGSEFLEAFAGEHELLRDLFGEARQARRRELIAKFERPLLELGDQLERELEGWRTSDVHTYLGDYVTYWSRDVLSHATVNLEEMAVRSWDTWRRRIGELKPEFVNQDLREFANLRKAALGTVQRFLSQARQVEVERAREEIDRELETLGRESFDAVCQECLGNWSRLTPDIAATRAILAATVAEWSPRYLKPYSTPGVTYWNSLLEESLRLFADESERDAGSRLKDIKAKSRFPLVRATAATEALGLTEIVEVYKRVREIDYLLGTGEQNTIGSGERTGFPRINAQLERLCGRDLIRGHVEWFRQLTKIVDALDQELECRIVILGQEGRAPLAGTTELSGQYRSLGLTLEGASSGNRVRTEPPNSDTGLRLDPQAASVSVVFYKFTRQEDEQPFEYRLGGERAGAPWAVIAELLGNRNVKRLPSGDVFAVPVEVSYTERKYTYWIGLKFNREMPDPSEWPTPKSWPD